MALTMNQIGALATDATFKLQVQAASVRFAHNAIAAAPTANNLLDEARWNLARSVLTDGGVSMVAKLAWGIAALPNFNAVPGDTGSANDAAIAQGISSAWNALALASGATLAGTVG